MSVPRNSRRQRPLLLVAFGLFAALAVAALGPWSSSAVGVLAGTCAGAGLLLVPAAANWRARPRFGRLDPLDTLAWACWMAPTTMTAGHLVWNEPPGEQGLAALFARMVVWVAVYEVLCLALPPLRLSNALSRNDHVELLPASRPLAPEHRFPRR